MKRRLLILAFFGICVGSLLSMCSLEAQAVLPPKPTLKFNSQGTFKIVMFSDVQDKFPINPQTIEAMNNILDFEKPEFVILVGDNCTGAIGSAEEFNLYVQQMVEPMEKRGIPWAHVYGNHDEDHVEKTGLTKELQQGIYESFPHCLSQRGPEEVEGVGNFVLPVYSSDGSKEVFAIWGLDSNAYLEDNNSWYGGRLENDAILENGLQGSHNYDFIKFSQIRWYWDTSVEMEKKWGYKIPGILFTHIPLPEHRLIVMNPEPTGIIGEKNEDVCNSPINSGLFAAILQRGDIKGIFVGHDHVNDFVGNYCGIKLGYDANIGFGTYGLEGEDKDRLRGARVFRINERTPQAIETWMRYASEFDKNKSSELLSSLLVIAHRGASGYLPEHTLESYAMAYALGADYIEQDVVLTKDKVFICLHDIYLEPTTNVEELYPERKREDGHWYAADFTLEEVKKLRVHERSKADGTPYFPERFPVNYSMFEVPTFEEAIQLIQGLNKSTGKNIGIYPEFKQPSWHEKEKLEGGEKILLDILQKYGYTEKKSGVFVQCFEPEALQKMRFELGTELPLIQLIGSGEEKDAQMLTSEGLEEIASYADGIGILKDYIENNPELVSLMREKGLLVHAWTFRKDAVPEKYPSYEKELEQLCRECNIDGLFTDFPDIVIKFLER